MTSIICFLGLPCLLSLSRVNKYLSDGCRGELKKETVKMACDNLLENIKKPENCFKSLDSESTTEYDDNGNFLLGPDKELYDIAVEKYDELQDEMKSLRLKKDKNDKHAKELHEELQRESKKLKVRCADYEKKFREEIGEAIARLKDTIESFGEAEKAEEYAKVILVKRREAIDTARKRIEEWEVDIAIKEKKAEEKKAEEDAKVKLVEERKALDELRKALETWEVNIKEKKAEEDAKLNEERKALDEARKALDEARKALEKELVVDVSCTDDKAKKIREDLETLIKIELEAAQQYNDANKKAKDTEKELKEIEKEDMLCEATLAFCIEDPSKTTVDRAGLSETAFREAQVHARELLKDAGEDMAGMNLVQLAAKQGSVRNISKSIFFSMVTRQTMGGHYSVNLFEQDRLGKTALHHASEAGRLEAVMFLIALVLKGHDIKFIDEDKRAYFEGCDVNCRDINRKTPLHWATDLEVASALIKAGADVNAIDKWGNTPRIVREYRESIRMEAQS